MILIVLAFVCLLLIEELYAAFNKLFDTLGDKAKKRVVKADQKKSAAGLSKNQLRDTATADQDSTDEAIMVYAILECKENESKEQNAGDDDQTSGSSSDSSDASNSGE